MVSVQLGSQEQRRTRWGERQRRKWKWWSGRGLFSTSPFVRVRILIRPSDLLLQAEGTTYSRPSSWSFWVKPRSILMNSNRHEVGMGDYCHDTLEQNSSESIKISFLLRQQLKRTNLFCIAMKLVLEDKRRCWSISSPTVMYSCSCWIFREPKSVLSTNSSLCPQSPMNLYPATEYWTTMDDRSKVLIFQR